MALAARRERRRGPWCRAESSSISSRVGWKAAGQLVVDGFEYGAHRPRSSILERDYLAPYLAHARRVSIQAQVRRYPRSPALQGGGRARPRTCNALKPGERACDHPGCRLAATARAPKSRDMLNEHYWFCQPHAAEYNRNWNFFAGMSEGEVRRRQQDELFTGGRPTWEMKAGRFSREAAAFGQQVRQGRGLSRPLQPVRQERRQARCPEPEDRAARQDRAQCAGRPRPRRERRRAEDPRPLHRAGPPPAPRRQRRRPRRRAAPAEGDQGLPVAAQGGDGLRFEDPPSG